MGRKTAQAKATGRRPRPSWFGRKSETPHREQERTPRVWSLLLPPSYFSERR